MLTTLPLNEAARHDNQANQATSPAPETIVPMTLVDAGEGRRDRSAGTPCGALASEVCMFVSMVMGVWAAAIRRRCRRQSFFGRSTAHLERALATREVDVACPAGAVGRGYRLATVGTEKRERQRANKAIKEETVAKAETREKTTRAAIIIGGAIVAVFAIVLIANLFIGGDDDAATTDALPTVPEAAGEVFAATGEFVPAGCPSPDGSAEQQQSFDAQPPMCLDSTVSYSALVTTNKGEITIELDQDKAPVTVNNFVFLARNQYFDDTTCHRIIPGFVVQCGDPTASTHCSAKSPLASTRPSSRWKRPAPSRAARPSRSRSSQSSSPRTDLRGGQAVLGVGPSQYFAEPVRRVGAAGVDIVMQHVAS